MKKTLIALAVAASAVVSGSAMAWTANSTGGTNVELGGTLTPVEKITPWEIQIGAAVTNLDAAIQKNQSVVDVAVNKAIPVLGIRTVEAKAFPAQAGINPVIDYNGSVNFNGMKNGVAKLTLSVQNGTTGTKIGTLSADILTGAGVARSDAVGGDAFSAYSNGNNTFQGGIGSSEGQVVSSLGKLRTLLNSINPEFTANFVQLDKPDVGTWRAPSFADGVDKKGSYSAFYGSGIESGKKIQIRLDAPAAADAIAWKASLPVTVSYQ
ncbi:hypothetical protein CHD15_26255 (plasmid) [Salmonella enterica]|uniref:F4 family fimbrial subunit n=1 Tax=Salmonella enterica TaxID=28901 RepID=UPI000DEC9DC0|nr:hypothetical protein [Salmonella enterica]AXD36187.1 hypothetical protein CHD15_26255 [Salmonella enterica]